MQPFALRPLSFGEVLDTSFNLFKRNFKIAVPVSLVVMVPLAVVAALATAGLAPTDFAVLSDPDPDPTDLLRFFGGLYGALGVGALLQQVGAVLVQAATTRLYAENYRGAGMAFKEAFQAGLRRLPAMLLLTLLTTVGLTVGLVACVVPGVWLYAAWGVAPAALIAEETGAWNSLTRSFSLVRGFWWRTFGILLLAGILVAVITSILTAPLSFAVGFGSAVSGDPAAGLSGQSLAASTLVGGLANAVTLPFTAAVVVAIYYDLRVRKEGYDLERLIADLDHAGPDRPPQGPTTDPFGLG
jgi:hypothetical protein